MAAAQSSASLASQLPLKSRDIAPTNRYGRLAYPPDTKASTTTNNQLCDVRPISFKVFDDRTGPAKAWIHIPQNYFRERTEPREKTAAILLSGADGGMLGPSSIYPSLADSLANSDNGIPVLRLNYRYAARLNYCITDVKAAMKYLQSRYSILRFILVGWSFGGALVSAIGGSDERVVACAMVASQRAETSGVRTMAPRPLLLLHGTCDRTMRYSASQELFEEYGEGGERRLMLVEGADHELSRHTRMIERVLCGFIMRYGVSEVGGEEVNVAVKTTDDGNERVKMIEESDALKGSESKE